MVSRLIAWIRRPGNGGEREDQVIPDPVIELLERVPVRQ